MRPGSTTWSGNARAVEFALDPRWGTRMVYAEWPAVPSADLQVVSTASTCDRAVDFAKTTAVTPLSAQERALYTSSTKLLPTDGIVGETSKRIVDGLTTDHQKAKAIYDWVVENTARNPKTRGCGLGNVSFMLETGDLQGKCADINGLYVALMRAAGIPARDLYGIRVAPSRFGYKSLGTSSDDITKAQHCRSEVFLSEYGWVPADPADVRKVMLEEPPGHLGLDNPKVADAKATLFGAWEGNYVAYNDGHDLALPGSDGPDVGFLMYPQAEVDGERRDSLSPVDFTYDIRVERIA
jgi:transglutaminase-like putative cysteine protease